MISADFYLCDIALILNCSLTFITNTWSKILKYEKNLFFSSPGRSRFLAILVSGTKTTSNLIFCFSVLLFFWFRLANWLRIKARLWSTNILSAKCQGNNDQFTRYISWNVAMMDAVTYQIYRELSQENLRMTTSCSVWYLMITFERYLANNSKKY